MFRTTFPAAGHRPNIGNLHTDRTTVEQTGPLRLGGPCDQGFEQLPDAAVREGRSLARARSDKKPASVAVSDAALSRLVLPSPAGASTRTT